MDLRREVGGLLTRNAVLRTLLMNYADRLQQSCAGNGSATAPCFIVPTWDVDRRLSRRPRSRVLTVEAHTSCSDPTRDEDLDAILRLVHVVLTDDHAGTSITARRLATSAEVTTSGRDTVVRMGFWEIVPVPSCDLGGTRPRLLPWPDCSAVTIAGALAASGVSAN
jgi:hypothetical protein